MYFLVIFIKFNFLFTCSCFFWGPNQIKTCVPRFHAWQPLCGVIPFSAFEAGEDRDGDKKYIARVISPDGRSWSAPTTLSGKSLILHYNWGKKVENANKFAEVLTVCPLRRGFGWRKASKLTLKDLSEECCLVEGGSGYQDGKKFVSWIGRTLNKGSYYIGGVREAEWSIFYVHHPMMYLDDSGTNHGISNEFEVLAYDCCTKDHCRAPNKADCCFDIWL